MLDVACAAAASLVALVALTGVEAHAAAARDEQPIKRQTPEHGIELTPGRIMLHVDPGGVARVSIQLRNTSRAPVTLHPSVIAGRGSRDPGSTVEPVLAAHGDRARDATSWMQLPPSPVRLAARHERRLSIPVRIPVDARPGAHVVILAFAQRTTRAGTGAGVDGSGAAASTVILEVSGEAEAAMRLTRVEGPRRIISGTHARFTARAENVGDTTLQLDARVELRPLVGRTRLLPMRSQTLLPGGARRIEVRFDDQPLIGRVAPTLTVVGGAGSGIRLTRTLPAVWILPPWWLAGSLIAATALPAGVAIRRRRR